MLPLVQLSSDVLCLLQGNERPKSVLLGVENLGSSLNTKSMQDYDCTDIFFPLVFNVVVFMTNCSNSELLNTNFAFRISSDMFYSGKKFADGLSLSLCPYIESLDIVNEPFSPVDRMDWNTESQEAFEARIQSMTGLKMFKMKSFYFPPQLVHVQHAPLTSFVLNSIKITQGSLEAIVSILRNCQTLDTVCLGSFFGEATALVDKSPIFDCR